MKKAAVISDCGFLGQCCVGGAAFMSMYAFTSLSFHRVCFAESLNGFGKLSSLLALAHTPDTLAHKMLATCWTVIS